MKPELETYLESVGLPTVSFSLDSSKVTFVPANGHFLNNGKSETSTSLEEAFEQRFNGRILTKRSYSYPQTDPLRKHDIRQNFLRNGFLIEVDGINGLYEGDAAELIGILELDPYVLATLLELNKDILESPPPYYIQGKVSSCLAGYGAEDIKKYTLTLFPHHGKKRDDHRSLSVKRNKLEEITAREFAVLAGIASDEELQRLNVRAPNVYQFFRKLLVTEHLDSPTVEELMQSDKVSDEKKRDLLYRIAEASQVIQRNTPKYLRCLENSGVTAYCKAESERRKKESLAQVAGLGRAHKKLVKYLKTKEMFDTWLPDARFANWVYDEYSKTLYKIDQNAVLQGSRYSCLARIADLDNDLVRKEVDNVLARMNPDNYEDAYLSLYVTNLERAFAFEKMGRKEIAAKMFKFASYYLSKVESDTIKLEKELFKKVWGVKPRLHKYSYRVVA